MKKMMNLKADLICSTIQTVCHLKMITSAHTVSLLQMTKIHQCYLPRRYIRTSQ
uniref:Uncharacterized protein n=1 Tax=Brassica oleracea TaxID=3712 RepID=A0A3P6F4M1_BRAOL|nr:unnamed protein product [Brassica oleracea]